MKKRDDIHNELKNLTPRLADVKATNPFSVPEGYFESLPNEVLKNAKRQAALVDRISNDLHNVATNPFAVPDNYFESLADNVMLRVRSEPKIIELKPVKWKNWLSIAAAVAAIVLVALPLLRPTDVQTQTDVTVTLNEVSNDELYNYVTEDVSVWHDEDVAAGLSESKLDTLEQELVAAHVSTYEDALLDLSQLDIETIDIESL